MLRSGSWQSNVGAHHSNQPTVLPSVSPCKPTTSKSSSGPPPPSWTMWHVFHMWSVPYCIGGPLCHLIPLLSSPRRLTHRASPEPTPAELNRGETPKAGLDHRHRLSAGPFGPSLTLMEPCKVPIISPLYREGRIRAA